MPSVVHLIDRNAPGDLLDRLQLLAGPEDRVLSVGSPPRWAPCSLPIKAVHRPLGPAELAVRWLLPHARGAKIVHAWSGSAARAGAALAERMGARLVWSLPTAPRPEEFDETLQAAQAGAPVATLVVPTESSRASLEQAGVPGGAVAVVPPSGQAIEDRSARRAQTRRALGVGEGERVLLALGEMIRPMGHKYVSWAHAIARQVVPVLLLVMPGGGPNERHVEFFAHTTGYDDQLFLTGDRFERADLLAAADLAALFCERDCGASALAGAMAAGLPLAASNTPDVAELAPHESAALLVPPASPRDAAAALLRLLEDGALADRLALAARQRAAERFDPAACRRAMDDVYAAARPAGVY